MVEEIAANLYRIEVPLPGNPLKALNSYVIRDSRRNLIIDTGMNRPECFAAMEAGLKALSIDLEKTDIFVTHLHADHSGQCGKFAGRTTKVYMSHVESQLLSSRPLKRERFRDSFVASGYPDDELIEALESHPGNRYAADGGVVFTPVKDGDTIQSGDYLLQCLETPGHSPQHICLYEARRKLLFSGDHILTDITPNITYWPEFENALQYYLDSLDKVYPLEVELVLPGHRRLITDHRKRIDEIRAHHRARLGEIMAALQDGEKNAWQIAPCITWEVKCDSWDEFPRQQKWFAFGETLAHLVYLERLGQIRRNTSDRKITFSLA